MALRKSLRGFGVAGINLFRTSGIVRRNACVAEIRAKRQHESIHEGPVDRERTLVFITAFDSGLACRLEQWDNLSLPNR